ncbi:MAG: hypothetical protein SFY67_14425 [Candidatus Melainabacteria bacterium]|nr:hypothetical protein [Candidatus Melainabacteria bacterium]
MTEPQGRADAGSDVAVNSKPTETDPNDSLFNRLSADLFPARTQVADNETFNYLIKDSNTEQSALRNAVFDFMNRGDLKGFADFYRGDGTNPEADLARQAKIKQVLKLEGIELYDAPVANASDGKKNEISLSTDVKGMPYIKRNLIIDGNSVRAELLFKAPLPFDTDFSDQKERFNKRYGPESVQSFLPYFQRQSTLPRDQRVVPT